MEQSRRTGHSYRNSRWCTSENTRQRGTHTNRHRWVAYSSRIGKLKNQDFSRSAFWHATNL